MVDNQQVSNIDDDHEEKREDQNKSWHINDIVQITYEIDWEEHKSVKDYNKIDKDWVEN